MWDYDRHQGHHHTDTTGLFWRRLRLFFFVLAMVLILSLIKMAVHWLEFEFLNLNALFTSAIAGAVFIIGFLLSSILGDYKEAERLPSDMRVAMEAINDDAAVFAEKEGGLGGKRIPGMLLDVLTGLRHALGPGCNYQHLTPVIEQVDKLTACFSEMEREGMPPNYVVRLRSEQSTLRRCLFRIYYIQKIEFVPSVHVLVQSLVGTVLFLLMFLKTEGSPESAIIFGAISFMFIYALRLIETLEQPYKRGSKSLDDVSLFLLAEFEQKLLKKKEV